MHLYVWIHVHAVREATYETGHCFHNICYWNGPAELKVALVSTTEQKQTKVLGEKVRHYKYELLMMTLGMSSCGPNLFLLHAISLS